MIVSGKYGTVRDIACEEKVSAPYISHLTQLAYLSPDIIQAILKGNIPAELTLTNLKKGFSMDWEKQRLQLGFNNL